MVLCRGLGRVKGAEVDGGALLCRLVDAVVRMAEVIVCVYRDARGARVDERSDASAVCAELRGWVEGQWHINMHEVTGVLTVSPRLLLWLAKRLGDTQTRFTYSLGFIGI